MTGEPMNTVNRGSGRLAVEGWVVDQRPGGEAELGRSRLATLFNQRRLSPTQRRLVLSDAGGVVHPDVCTVTDGGSAAADRLSRGATSTVLTVGTVRVSPNFLTAVPGEVELGLDARTTNQEEMDHVLSQLFGGSAEAAQSREVGVEKELLSSVAPTVLDERLTFLAERVCRDLGVPSSRCASMAGHDVQHLGCRVPAALLFVPSANGVSHAPGEEIDWKDAESALEVLSALLQKL
jgi:acetylornithine deacetylase/succinyl-diaminopimelate desuccinylase-like protein